MRDYERAMVKFKRSEVELSAALDKLSESRDAGDAGAITVAYKLAQRLELACCRAWEVAEDARRAYWNACAKQAENELMNLAAPLLGAIEHCSRAGAATVSHPAHMVLTQLSGIHRPPYAAKDPAPPIVPTDSDVLERAENSNIMLLRGSMIT
jgi:hypothetical protein